MKLVPYGSIVQIAELKIQVEYFTIIFGSDISAVWPCFWHIECAKNNSQFYAVTKAFRS